VYYSLCVEIKEYFQLFLEYALVVQLVPMVGLIKVVIFQNLDLKMLVETLGFNELQILHWF
jgi:hypothetical protein